MRVVAAVMGLPPPASGRLTVQHTLEPVVLPDPLGKHQWPRYPRKGHCAAVLLRSYPLLARVVDPPKSGSGWDTRPSSERPEFLCSHTIAALIWATSPKKKACTRLPSHPTL